MQSRVLSKSRCHGTIRQFSFQNPVYRALVLASSFSLSSSFLQNRGCFERRRFQRTPFPKTGSLQWYPLSSSSKAKDRGGDTQQQQTPSSIEQILSKHSPEDHEILRETIDWLQRVVIGLNLCPFAERPFRSKKMNFEVIRGSDEEEVIALVLAECLVKQRKPGTSLMICPDLYPTNFESFLEVHNVLSEGVLVDRDLTDDIQIAPFHPLFEFEGSGDDGLDNYTNRSPYPIFHILREEEVEKAVDLLDGDAGKVWRRNVSLLEELGNNLDSSQFRDVMSGGEVEQDVRKKVADILADFRNKDF